MNFEWSNEQLELLPAAERFAIEQLNDPVVESDRLDRFNAEAWKKCGEFGIQGLPVPTEFGGFGADALTTVGVSNAWAIDAETTDSSSRSTHTSGLWSSRW